MDLNNHHTDDVIQIVIPYKDQDAAVYVKRQRCQFGLKIKIPKKHAEIDFTSTLK